MARRKVKSSLLMSALMFFCAADVLVAVVKEPDEYPDYQIRGRRIDYLHTWHVFGEGAGAHNNGILNPGDKRLDKFVNWWTPVSASTQHNYAQRTQTVDEDWSSAPMSHRIPPTESYWLPLEENVIAFYMTYSQYDNSDFQSEYDFAWMGPEQKARQQQNMSRNGWAFAWVTNKIDRVAGNFVNADKPGDYVGNVKMDIFIHNGKSNALQGTDVADYADRFDGTTTYTYGTVERSNPQVSLSTDIHPLAEYKNTDEFVPPDYRDDNTGLPQGYVYASFNDVDYTNEPDFNTVVASMEVREVDPGFDDPVDPLAGTAIHSTKTPWETYDNLTDGHGDPYAYQDAFYNRADTVSDPSLTTGAPYAEGSTDGGVIPGLSGYSDYDPSEESPDWGEQQVIRIDFDASTFATITHVKFYDFGEKGGSTQIAPRVIAFAWGSDGFTTGLFYDADVNDGPFNLGAGDYMMPDNRVYIAQVAHIPEPATFAFVMLGGLGVLARNRMRRRRN